MRNEGLKILAVDDKPDNLITIKAVLKDIFPGIKVLTALTGLEGIDLARKEDPDVIFLDILMPEIDGFEICRRLKNDEKTRMIPVLFLTALSSTPKVRMAALDAGAEGFLAKPFDEAELVAQTMSMAKIKKANTLIQGEKERLEEMVEERTKELRKELVKRIKVEHNLVKSEQSVKMKLESLLSPTGDISKLRLSDIIDIEATQNLMSDFHKITGILVAILDVNGEVLVSQGWQDICMKFHRVHPETSRKCKESDTCLSLGVASGEYKIYKCKNNMWDMVTPIMINDTHIGNIFMGQFLFEDEKIDYMLFRNQAREYGFDEKEYIAALNKVPRFKRERSDAVMKFYADFANMFALLGFRNVQLARAVSQQDLLLGSLKISEEQFKTIFAQAPVGMALIDSLTGRIYDCNLKFNEILGTTKEKTVNADWLPVMKMDDSQEYIDNMARLDTGGTESFNAERQFKRNDLSAIWINLSMTSIRLYESNRKMYLSVIEDITERKTTERRILYANTHDHLTGLYNHEYFIEKVGSLDVEQNLPLTVIIVDINGLKLINNAFGQSSGDLLLVKTAEILSKELRPGDFIARIGGDEFLILLTQTSADEAEQTVKRIKDVIVRRNIGTPELSVSFGSETKTEPSEDLNELMKKAENDLNRRKLFESPSMRGKTIYAIINTLHEKNKREEQHSQRVSRICEAMGSALGLPEKDINELKTVGLLHDIGKIAIDESILNKPSKLTQDEWKEIQRHPEIGYRILGAVAEMSDLSEYVLAHHERPDGKGYPLGINGDAIPFQSRIIAIADAYDAMTSERTYRGAMPEEVALNELRKYSGTQFDPELVRIFIEKVYKKEKSL